MEVGDVNIRQLTPADAAAYRAIRLAGLEQNPEAFGSTFEAEFAKPLAWFFGRLSEATVFGAFCDREILGVAGFASRTTEKEAHKGLLWGMYVRPEARGTGVARRLVEAVIEFARIHVEVLQLSVVVGNERARRLYAGFGFVEYGIERNSLKQDGRYFDEALMALDLVSSVPVRAAPGTGVTQPGDSNSAPSQLAEQRSDSGVLHLGIRNLRRSLSCC